MLISPLLPMSDKVGAFENIDRFSFFPKVLLEKARRISIQFQLERELGGILYCVYPYRNIAFHSKGEMLDSRFLFRSSWRRKLVKKFS